MYSHAIKATRRSNVAHGARDSSFLIQYHQRALFTRSFTRSSKPQDSPAVTETTTNDQAGATFNLTGGKINSGPYRQYVASTKESGNNSKDTLNAIKQTQVDQTASSNSKALSQPATSATKDVVDNLSSSMVETVQESAIQMYHWGKHFIRVPFWQEIPRWKDWSEKDFLNSKLLTMKNIAGLKALEDFLREVLPNHLPINEKFQHIRTREDFIEDVRQANKHTTMSIRLAPHVLSLIDWNNPFEDQLRLQFIPLKSEFVPDHPVCSLDSLHEKNHKVLPNLVHRYPDKVLFLTNSTCPHYCRYCTRSYAIGQDTEIVDKDTVKGGVKRWMEALNYINSNPAVQDVVLSGGDSYLLPPEYLRMIGNNVLAIPHVRRVRIASKGLCVSPSRILDPDDTWTDELIGLSNRGKMVGKEVYYHTHFNHPQEISWVTREASQKLFQNGVKVRNQTVLLRGVNDSVDTMSALIRNLIDNHIDPYYVYQCDMVRGIEDLRTPLTTILKLQHQIRGSIGGYAMPSFVVDLPGGGGKRLANDYISYDPDTGLSKWKSPAVQGGDQIYEYHDPVEFTKEGKRGRVGKS